MLFINTQQAILLRYIIYILTRARRMPKTIENQGFPSFFSLANWEEFCAKWEEFCVNGRNSAPQLGGILRFKCSISGLTGRNSALNGRNSAFNWEKFCVAKTTFSAFVFSGLLVSALKNHIFCVAFSLCLHLLYCSNRRKCP